MRQKVFDPAIDFYYAENHDIVFTSGAEIVSAAYVGFSHLAAAARIAELEARVAELENEVATLMLTPPLPEWMGNQGGVTAYDGAALQDTFHEVMTSGRLP